MLRQKQTNELIERLSELDAPVLSVYADINPANPDNKGGAWRIRVKNALKDIEEIQKRTERSPSLYEAVLELLAEERPAARTMALFARQNHLGKTFVERVDLQVGLPVVDLRRGRVEARWGEPYLMPLIHALDEYERTAVLHIDGAGWRFFELYMGEIEERSDIFREFDEEDWKELSDAAEFIRSGRLREKTEPTRAGDSRDPYRKKRMAWLHKLHVRLARLLDKALRALHVDRLVIMGDEDETGPFCNVLPRHLRERIVARIHNPKNEKTPNIADIRARVEPVLAEAERVAEMALLDEISEQPGIRGLAPVLEALQIGRIDTLAVPFDLDAKAWTCPDSGLLSPDPAELRELCDRPEEISLRDHIFALARDYGTRLEFVEGAARERLLREFGGIAGKRRW